ncbi:MAG: hypothetical protein KDJ37_10815 [Hyphomicrobiaceae bacterium]|nr:hypothetical protein [Hyphomicrobiaceae bacterium]
MRYLIAMISGIIVALGVTVYLSTPVASWVVAQFSFDSPDQVADLHSLVFMLVNVAALAVGWMIGWAIGGMLRSEPPLE